MDSTFYFQHVNSEIVLITDGKGRHCYLPQMKFAKVMFLHLSVSHSVHGGWVSASVHAGIHTHTHTLGKHPLGADPLYPKTDPTGHRHPPGGETPPGAKAHSAHCMLGDMGNKWAVRILHTFFRIVCLFTGRGRAEPPRRQTPPETDSPPPSGQMPPLGRKIFCVMY